jgi:PIN domain nuclease of toxin-antitoxin system
MNKIFVVDTCALISFYQEVFGESSSISYKSLKIIERAFLDNDIKLIFPSIVFIELFRLYFKTKEIATQIKYEVLNPISEQENMQIRSFDKESLEKFIQITDIESNYNFDNHDKQILATAMVMNCPLITSDLRIKRYNQRKRVIPLILD